jgi:hypothetical protein
MAWTRGCPNSLGAGQIPLTWDSGGPGAKPGWHVLREMQQREEVRRQWTTGGPTHYSRSPAWAENGFQKSWWAWHRIEILGWGGGKTPGTESTREQAPKMHGFWGRARVIKPQVLHKSSVLGLGVGDRIRWCPRGGAVPGSILVGVEAPQGLSRSFLGLRDLLCTTASSGAAFDPGESKAMAKQKQQQ